MTVTREQAAIALFNLVSTSSTYKYTSRRFQMWDQVPANQKPALFQVEHEETHTRGKTATPAIRTLDIDIWVYIASGRDPNYTPITDLNNLIDAIDPVSGGVLVPDNWQNRQTLGNLVYDCFIDGKITKVSGDLDGNGLAIIPIKIIFHQAS